MPVEELILAQWPAKSGMKSGGRHERLAEPRGDGFGGVRTGSTRNRRVSRPATETTADCLLLVAEWFRAVSAPGENHAPRISREKRGVARPATGNRSVGMRGIRAIACRSWCSMPQLVSGWGGAWGRGLRVRSRALGSGKWDNDIWIPSFSAFQRARVPLLNCCWRVGSLVSRFALAARDRECSKPWQSKRRSPIQTHSSWST